MSQRRDVETLLQHYRQVSAGSESPAGGWRRFYDSANRHILVAVIRGLMQALQPDRRAAIEHYLGLSAAAFSTDELLPHYRVLKSGETITIDCATRCTELIQGLASGKPRLSKMIQSTPRCGSEALLEQLCRLTHAMKTAPKRVELPRFGGR